MSKLTNLKVGQVLYIVVKSDGRVVPVRVVEEVSRKTLDGEKKTFNVQVGPTAEKPLDLEKIAGDKFMSVAEVKNFMIENATQAINKLVKNAHESADKWYGTTDEVVNGDYDYNVPLESVTAESNSESTQPHEMIDIALPDGRMASVKANLKVMPTQKAS
jgi:hypothetical protein